MTYPFTYSKVTRTCQKTFARYRCYLPYLKEDFNHRCAFCNTHDCYVQPLPFQVDHFIPRKVFEEAGRYDYETRYDNLMYACPKCNRLKSSLYQGDIRSEQIVNELFLNPDIDDINDYLYRDEEGRVLSEDPRGRNVINILHLYRISVQIAWILDGLYLVLNNIEAKLAAEDHPDRAAKLKIMEAQVGNIIRKQENMLRTLYWETPKQVVVE